MLFNSVNYAIFLPIILIIYFLLPFNKKHGEERKNANINRYRNIFLLIASYFFYMCWIPQYAILIMFSTIVTYTTAIFLDRIENPKKRKIALFFNILINFGILFIFKYYNFFLDNLNKVLVILGSNYSFSDLNVLLPVGISFYTFQAVGYSIDVYRKDIKHEKNFITYALFVSFFPQLVAGPIERAKTLLPQFYEAHKFNYKNAVSGMKLILIGLFKKIAIADMLSIFVNAVFNNVENYEGLTLIAAILAFSIQIYCDFSGYSDIAIGTAKILGFKLMDNFNVPYLSSSIGEFWTRWHISLNTWFKDYVYIPLGGNRKGKFRKCVNLFLVFFLSGLWHGANWTFIIWGCLNGFYRIIQELLKKCENFFKTKMRFADGAKRIFKIGITYSLVCFSWIFFRANNIYDAKYIIGHMLKNISISSTISDLASVLNENLIELTNIKYFYVFIIMIGIGILAKVDFLKFKSKDNNYDSVTFKSHNKIIRWSQYIFLTLLIIFLFTLENGIHTQVGQFIYFQF